jgi:hypothetical protein
VVGENEFCLRLICIDESPDGFRPDGAIHVLELLHCQENGITVTHAGHISKLCEAFWGSEFLHTHVYVAQWYQRRFLPAIGEKTFHYLDLKPDQFRDPNGVLRQKKALNRWGTDRCFKQTDLYTTRFGAWESTEIERFFFGRVDTEGRDAIQYFSGFVHPDANQPAFTHLLNYRLC